MLEYKDFNLYRDIQKRTGGELFIGVVGPVRTGKSTFVRRFMSQMVIPSMEENHQSIATDELPVSGKGTMITTVEPKFVPKEAALLTFNHGKIDVRLRLIDCVGYVVDGAAGVMDNEGERMVKTPWFKEEIPFSKAAHIGTEKVIRDHSTVGIVLTSDGSFGEITRQQFEPAEEKTVGELRAIGKPFVIVLNCTQPDADDTKKLCHKLSEKYRTAVLPVNCDRLSQKEIDEIMSAILFEFPVSAVNFFMPEWFDLLPADDKLRAGMLESAKSFMENVFVIRDIENNKKLLANEFIENYYIDEMNMATGNISITICLKPCYYFEMMSRFLGSEVHSFYAFAKEICSLAEKKQRFDKVAQALTQVEQKGYGAVMPVRDEIVVEEPVIIKHGSKYGVNIKVNAPSIHMISANIETEIAPLVGTQKQAQDLVDYIKASAGENEDGSFFDTLILGKSMGELVDEGVKTKISKMTDACQEKMQETLQKIINESNGSVIFVII